MFVAFGDVVPMWSTVNEPIAVYVGYAHGGFVPDIRMRKRAIRQDTISCCPW